MPAQILLMRRHRDCDTIARMLGPILRLVCSALAVFLVTLIGVGVGFGEGTSTTGKVITVVVVALVLGVVNAVLKPIIKLIGFGFYLLTLGLVSLLVNGLLFWFAGWLTRNLFGLQFNVDFPVGAIVGALLISLVSFVLGLVIKDRGE